MFVFVSHTLHKPTQTVDVQPFLWETSYSSTASSVDKTNNESSNIDFKFILPGKATVPDLTGTHSRGYDCTKDTGIHAAISFKEKK